MPYLRGGGGCAAGLAARSAARAVRAAHAARAARGAARPRAAAAAGPWCRGRSLALAGAQRHGPALRLHAPHPAQLKTCPRPLHPISMLDIPCHNCHHSNV